MSTTPREKSDRPSICIDGFNLAASQGTGIETYSRNLLEAASRLGFRTEAPWAGAKPILPGVLPEQLVLAPPSMLPMVQRNHVGSRRQRDGMSVGTEAFLYNVDIDQPSSPSP